jgi:hypothetical protein
MRDIKKNIIELIPELAKPHFTFQYKLSHFQHLTGLSITPIIHPIIHPWGLTGFIDGDGLNKYKNLNKLNFWPSLSISLY